MKHKFDCIYSGANPGSPAELSGLEIGDVIKKINGNEINCPEDWDNLIALNVNPVIVEVIRNNKSIIVSIDKHKFMN